MGFQSQAGSVGFKTQSVKGTYAPAGIFMRTRSGALAPTRSLLIPDPEIGGNRDVSDAYLGPYVVEGEYDFYTRFDSFATLLAGALGPSSDSATGSGSTLVGVHTIVPVDGLTALPWLSIEENIANNLDHFRYTDGKVNTLHLEAGAETYVTGKAGIVALSSLGVPNASATADPKPFDTGPLYVGTNVTATLGGVALPAKSFTLDINNNLEKNDFRLGSLSLGDTTEMRRLMTAGFKIRSVDNGIWRQAVYGTASATQAGGLVTRQQLVVTINSYEFIGTTATLYSLAFTVPKAIIQPFALAPSGDSVIEEDITMQWVRPDPATPICTAVITNHLATVV